MTSSPTTPWPGPPRLTIVGTKRARESRERFDIVRKTRCSSITPVSSQHISAIALRRVSTSGVRSPSMPVFIRSLPMRPGRGWLPSGGRMSKTYGFGPVALGRVFDDSPGDTRSKIVALYVLLAVANIGAWVLAFVAFANRPLLLGTALLAYTFGLRHAVDADHISAIDNVTRKLMQTGKKPVSVGFFFSLGHSTIVIALTAAIAFAATIVHARLPGLESIGGVIGASISALFLYAIAAINIVVLIEVYRTFQRVRLGGGYSDPAVDACLNGRGFLLSLIHI